MIGIVLAILIQPIPAVETHKLPIVVKCEGIRIVASKKQMIYDHCTGKWQDIVLIAKEIKAIHGFVNYDNK